MLRLASSRSGIDLESEEFPPLPEVSWKVLELTSDLYWGAVDLERIVSRDSALTVKILKISNSAFFGVRGEVSTVSRAAVVLGKRRLRSIVVTASLEGVFHCSSLGRSLWEHSLGVGLAARQLAEECDYTDPEDAFVGGLIHDIGKNFLDLKHPDLFGEAVDRISRKDVFSTDAERTVLGIDHTEVGFRIGRKWNLPPHLREVIRYHHSPMDAELDLPLCAIVQLADAVCLKTGIGPISKPDLRFEPFESSSILGADEVILQRISEEVQIRLKEDKRIFGLS